MAETATLSRFEVIFDAEGVNTSKFRNDVKVHLRGPYAVSYELPTDEGGIHGGNGSASARLFHQRAHRLCDDADSRIFEAPRYSG
jgi:hypothetical protein